MICYFWLQQWWIHRNLYRYTGFCFPAETMPELVQAAQVYAPTRTLQIWKSLLNWLAFFFQIFVQILKGTPCVTQVLSYFGVRNSSLLSSSPQFKPLPDVEPPEEEEAPPPSSVALSTLQITTGSVPISVEEEHLQKLTVNSRN